jgi:hypothetical protein
MAKYPQWDGKVYKRVKFGDISIKGTAKEHEMKLQRQRFARREAEAEIAVAEIVIYEKSGPGLSSVPSST